MNENLIDGIDKLSINELQLLKVALAKYEDEYVVISISDFLKNSENAEIVSLVKTAKSLLRKPLSFHFDGVQSELVLFCSLSANSEESHIILRFSEQVLSRLEQLKTDLCLISFPCITNLNGKFARKLYIWLILSPYTDQLILNIDWIKSRMGFSVEYSDYRVLRRKLIEPAINVINQVTKIYIEFSPIRTNGKVTDLNFLISKNKNTPKPIRKRLPRRPKNLTDNFSQTKWAKQCIQEIGFYELELLNYGYKLPMLDLKKLRDLYDFVGDLEALNEIQKEINIRSTN